HGVTITLQTPAGNVMLPMQMFQGPPPGQLLAGPAMLALLQGQPALRQELASLWQDGRSDGAILFQDTNGDGQAEAERLAAEIAQDPRLLEHAFRWLQANPEVQSQLLQRTVATMAVSGGAPQHIGSESPLFRATRQGECGVLERLLGQVNAMVTWTGQVNAHGDSLLHVAVWFGQARVASLLLARGHPLNIPS
ncbi:unnamed protein product, partial [Polarella glacialis]